MPTSPQPDRAPSDGTSESIRAADSTTPALDWSTYRVGSLAEHLVDLISLPLMFRRVIMATFITIVLVLTGSVWLIPLSELNIVAKTGVVGYSMTAGLLLGVAIGLLRVVAIAMRSIEEIMRVILEMTNQAAADYERLQSGNARMPGGAELMEQIYEGVVLPVIQAAVSKSFGFLSRPIYWLYRRSVGAAVHLVIRTLKQHDSGDADGGQAYDQLEAGVETALEINSEYSRQIAQFTGRAAAVVSRIGGRIRWFATAPLYVGLAVVSLIVLTPLLVVWYVTAPQ